MKLSFDHSTTSADLTYCTNIHPGEAWSEVRHNLETFGVAVRAQVAAKLPFSLGLRLSNEAASTLREPAQLRAFVQWLDGQGMYIRTLNGFPFGAFHGTTVKEDVYRPDWTEETRVEYSLSLAEILGALLPEGQSGSISTVPGCYGRDSPGAQREAIVRNLVRVAHALWRIQEARGCTIVLALEPEPDCLLQTTTDALEFLQTHVFSGPGLAAMCRTTGLGRAQAEIVLRRHVGLCLDLCHAAVEYEDPQDCVTAPSLAGVRLAKVQISSGLRLAPLTPAQLAALQHFADPVYLHQVVARTRAGLIGYPDLTPALASGPLARGDEEWRIHFHVPIFCASLGAFETTQFFLREALQKLRQTGGCDCFEIETYTWDVLPPAFRTSSVVEAIAREFAWVLEQWRV